jgi:hypothetical protein
MGETIPPEALLWEQAPAMAAIGMRLREVVFAAVPDALERVRPGWRVIGYDVPVGRRTSFFAWIWAQPEHVHLGFPHGVVLDEPPGTLEGAGVTKRARWFTVAPGDSPDIDELRRVTLAAAELARLRARGG